MLCFADHISPSLLTILCCNGYVLLYWLAPTVLTILPCKWPAIITMLDRVVGNDEFHHHPYTCSLDNMPQRVRRNSGSQSHQERRCKYDYPRSPAACRDSSVRYLSTVCRPAPTNQLRAATVHLQVKRYVVLGILSQGMAFDSSCAWPQPVVARLAMIPKRASPADLWHTSPFGWHKYRWDYLLAVKE